MLSKIIRPNVLVKEKISIGGEEVEGVYLTQGDVHSVDSGRRDTLQEKMQKEREKAYRSGFQDGKSMGLEEGRKQGEKVASDFFSLLEDIRIQKERILGESEKTVVELSLALASKIIGTEVEVKPETVLAVARNAIHQLVDKSRVLLRVNPRDYEIVKRQQNNLRATVDGIKSLEIEEDVRVNPGGCLIETDSGNVDARLESQIEVLKEALLDNQLGTSRNPEG